MLPLRALGRRISRSSSRCKASATESSFKWPFARGSLHFAQCVRGIKSWNFSVYGEKNMVSRQRYCSQTDTVSDHIVRLIVPRTVDTFSVVHKRPKCVFAFSSTQKDPRVRRQNLEKCQSSGLWIWRETGVNCPSYVITVFCFFLVVLSSFRLLISGSEKNLWVSAGGQRLTESAGWSRCHSGK